MEEEEEDGGREANIDHFHKVKFENLLFMIMPWQGCREDFCQGNKAVFLLIKNLLKTLTCCVVGNVNLI